MLMLWGSYTFNTLNIILELIWEKGEGKLKISYLPLIFQDIQTNSPCDGTNIRMPYFSDKPDLEI